MVIPKSKKEKKKRKSFSKKLVSKTCPQREWEALKRTWCEELEEERDFCAGTSGVERWRRREELGSIVRRDGEEEKN